MEVGVPIAVGIGDYPNPYYQYIPSPPSPNLSIPPNVIVTKVNKLCKIAITLTIFVVTFVACRKKEVPPANSSPTADNCTYSSYFNVLKTYTISNNNLFLANCKPDVFLQRQCTAQYSHNPPTGLSLTSVSLNNTSLTISDIGYCTLIYSDTLNRYLNPPYTWNIVGGNSYPSFNVVVPDSFPVFYNHHLLPDTIKKSQANVVYLNGKNATNISIRIENDLAGPDPQSKYNNTYLCAQPSTATSSVSFNGPTNFPNSSTNYLVIEYSKKSSQLIDNKTIYFTTSSIYKKQIVLWN